MTRKTPTWDRRCGTRPGYRAHLDRGEKGCTPCCDANSAYEHGRVLVRRGLNRIVISRPHKLCPLQTADRTTLVHMLRAAGVL